MNVKLSVKQELSKEVDAWLKKTEVALNEHFSKPEVKAKLEAKTVRFMYDLAVYGFDYAMNNLENEEIE